MCAVGLSACAACICRVVSLVRSIAGAACTRSWVSLACSIAGAGVCRHASAACWCGVSRMARSIVSGPKVARLQQRNVSTTANIPAAISGAAIFNHQGSAAAIPSENSPHHWPDVSRLLSYANAAPTGNSDKFGADDFQRFVRRVFDEAYHVVAPAALRHSEHVGELLQQGVFFQILKSRIFRQESTECCLYLFHVVSVACINESRH